MRPEWGGILYPCVPGHEIVGTVSAVGAGAQDFKVGDTVGVDCMVDSCQHCAACGDGLEQYCENGFVGTYNGPSTDAPGHTLGGYAQRIVVDDKFVPKIRHPREQLAAVAALLCAGITTWSPLRHWNVGPGRKVGAPEHPHPSPQVSSLIFKRRSIAGALIGGIAETQEMLDFCAEKNVVSDSEPIPIQDIDNAYEGMLRSDVKYSVVIDNASLAG